MNNLRLPPPRGSPSGLRLRSTHSSDHSPASNSKESKDRIVQQTDQDASQSRVSAVETGYLHDDFAKAFCAQEGARKFPLINRGTFVRTTALDRLVNTFLSASPNQRKQIICFGAGSDTRYFRLRQSLPPDALKNLVYHEIDFAAVTTSKVAAILRNQFLPSADIKAVDEAAGYLVADGYYIHPLDLRSLQPGCQMITGVEPDTPTLFISECCLIYLSPEEADAIVRWSTGDFTGSVGMVIYEPIGGEDAFGKVMIQNLASRGIVLKTLKKYSTLERQRLRFKALGFVDGQQAADVYFISEEWIGESEKERIARLEMLDEVEEWRLLARHYCVAWAWRGEEFAVWKGAVPLQTE
ncbi:S-adenosyl-L-methionine-dependent methyltransferase [Sphaerosporella brunnea]|uniref:Leucine carboxyl methyltransferase 1 n=1 Tax=Sphaerosporella brunnea TaxID=1250544 RepID=A0A5J5FAD0_9PEZI|nr:S-adenosyl-L-methionine-dependent methyltransferase [Sphaerosporella brunnea]